MSYYWNLQEDLRAQCVDDRHALWRDERVIQMRQLEIGGRLAPVAIRLVETRDGLRKACDLINDRYSWRGYGSTHRVPTDSHHVTFTAETQGQIAGTITLAVDSPNGLAVDHAFKTEIDIVRAESDAVVCELTKFAFDPGVRSKALMAALFHIVFVYGSRAYGGTDLVIEVNPRHVRFYETMLGFQKIGAQKTNESVAAPAQLMWLKVSNIRTAIKHAAEMRLSSESRSLYPLFFSPTEEDGIFQRLKGGGDRWCAQCQPDSRSNQTINDYSKFSVSTLPVHAA